MFHSKEQVPARYLCVMRYRGYRELGRLDGEEEK
jgi:hypothetical protein